MGPLNKQVYAEKENISVRSFSRKYILRDLGVFWAHKAIPDKSKVFFWCNKSVYLLGLQQWPTFVKFGSFTLSILCLKIETHSVK